MAYIDELRNRTRSQQELEDERRKKAREEFEEHISTGYFNVKRCCEEAAAKGERSVVAEYGIFSSRAEAREKTDRVIKMLESDGFTGIRYSIKKYAGHRDILSSYIVLHW